MSVMTLRERILAAIYLVFASRLPASTAPGGRVYRAVRALVATPLLARAGSDVNIERGAYFGDGTAIELGDRSGIGVNCRLHGPVSIGRDVMMGPDVVILARQHGIADVTTPMRTQQSPPPRRVVIEDDVWIGTRAIILPGRTVRRGAVVAAAAVVTKDVPEFAIVAGNPAEIKGYRGTIGE